ncbi:hypothetical protein SCLCIDRAFT_1216694 [Scleroderma citrinum Foug A]|uniref:Uncharacterized protein n=1 Tax=Scleroderma citrinum Foug A TaxID=1036808 RepID=A0A0C2ZG47_9AGAM|nr:hypothetical protein SCLCIDRAFT_1216694 [Scleroderma citrinum Foug A]
MKLLQVGPLRTTQAQATDQSNPRFQASCRNRLWIRVEWRWDFRPQSQMHEMIRMFRTER